jgi:hypothetical protein
MQSYNYGYCIQWFTRMNLAVIAIIIIIILIDELEMYKSFIVDTNLHVCGHMRACIHTHSNCVKYIELAHMYRSFKYSDIL